MAEHPYHALVVDDDPIARKVVAFALASEGFECDQAGDGVEALRQMVTNKYDLVVTDLLMPNKHGHALTVELLRRKTPPVLVVHSSVDDIRLTKDLMERGVDDIVYKPTNYTAFAAKMVGLVKRRRQVAQSSDGAAGQLARDGAPPVARAAGRGGTTAAAGAARGPARDRETPVEVLAARPRPIVAANPPDAARVPAAEYLARIITVQSIPPISQAAIALVEEVRQQEIQAGQLATTIQQDAALTADVMRVANSPYYNGRNRPIVDVAQAVARIGMRRLGEIAVAMSAARAFDRAGVAWIDKQLASRRSLAGGIAVSHLLASSAHQIGADCMVLAAVLYPLGRVILGTLYPDTYQRLLARSRESLLSLQRLERDEFPEPHTAAAARVLDQWGLPADVCDPLALAGRCFAELNNADDPQQLRAAVVKTGVLLGRIAVGHWLEEDTIDLPPAALLDALGLASLDALLERVRAEVGSHACDPLSTSSGGARGSTAAAGKLRYCQPAPGPTDLVLPLLISLGFDVDPVPAEQCGAPAAVVINGTTASAAESVAHWPIADASSLAIVNGEPPAPLRSCGHIVRLPASYGELRTACQRIAQADNRP